MTTLVLADLLDGAQAILPPAPANTASGHCVKWMMSDAGEWLRAEVIRYGNAEFVLGPLPAGASINSDRERTSR